MATPMQSFLHSHADMLAGKRIALFASSGSSLISTSGRDAASLVPDATFEESLLLTSSTLDDTPRGCTPVPGDITIYEPWGNVAIFCRDWSQSNSLIKIGHIDDNGMETFNVPDDITVRFEKQ